MRQDILIGKSKTTLRGLTMILCFNLPWTKRTSFCGAKISHHGTSAFNQQIKRNLERPPRLLFSIDEARVWAHLAITFCDIKLGRKKEFAARIYRTGHICSWLCYMEILPSSWDGCCVRTRVILPVHTKIVFQRELASLWNACGISVAL